MRKETKQALLLYLFPVLAVLFLLTIDEDRILTYLFAASIFQLLYIMIAVKDGKIVGRGEIIEMDKDGRLMFWAAATVLLIFPITFFIIPIYLRFK